MAATASPATNQFPSSTLSSPQFTSPPIDTKASHTDTIPIIDFSQLTSADARQRSKALQELDNACREWGFFTVVNHGIPTELMKDIIKTSLEFFDLPEEDRTRYEPKAASDPIKSGIGSGESNWMTQKIQTWRNYVNAYVHPVFHCPEKPQHLRDIVPGYCQMLRSLVRELLRAIGENLGLDDGQVDRELAVDSSFQVYAANFYPSCPHPDKMLGLPSHTDPGLLTCLIHNGVPGLHVLHDGEWFDAHSPENAILVNVGDHLEKYSDKRYKSVRHRAAVNNEVNRISVVVANGPGPDVVVRPAGSPPGAPKEPDDLLGHLTYVQDFEVRQAKRLQRK